MNETRFSNPFDKLLNLSFHLADVRFTCAQAGSWTCEIPLQASRFPPREFSAQGLPDPAWSKPVNIDWSAGCVFWKVFRLVWKWMVYIYIKMQCSSQNGKGNVSEKRTSSSFSPSGPLRSAPRLRGLSPLHISISLFASFNPLKYSQMHI